MLQVTAEFFHSKQLYILTFYKIPFVTKAKLTTNFIFQTIFL